MGATASTPQAASGSPIAAGWGQRGSAFGGRSLLRRGSRQPQVLPAAPPTRGSSFQHSLSWQSPHPRKLLHPALPSCRIWDQLAEARREPRRHHPHGIQNLRGWWVHLRVATWPTSTWGGTARSRARWQEMELRAPFPAGNVCRRGPPKVGTRRPCLPREKCASQLAAGNAVGAGRSLQGLGSIGESPLHPEPRQEAYRPGLAWKERSADRPRQ